jgi:photosystem II stability/assembly factor-like uncharacterized protein
MAWLQQRMAFVSLAGLALVGCRAREPLPVVDLEAKEVKACRFSLVSFRDERAGWLSDMCGNVFRSDDGGLTWRHDTDAEEAMFGKDKPDEAVASKQPDPLAEAFAAGAGKSLQELARMGRRGHLEFMHWFSPTDAVTGGDIKSSVLRTTDGGRTWQRIATPSDQWVYSVSASANAMWLCGSLGAIVRSLDRGLTWSGRPSPFNPLERCMEITIGADGQGKALGLYGSRWTTSDGGETWTHDPTSPPLPSDEDAVGAPAGVQRAMMKMPDGSTRWPRVPDRPEVQAKSAGLSSARGKGTVRIEKDLLVFETPGEPPRSLPPHLAGSGRTARLEAVEHFGLLAYGWTQGKLFLAEDGRSWYLAGDLPAARGRVTFVSAKAVVLDSPAGTFRSEDRGQHWKPSSNAWLDLRDADRVRARAVGREMTVSSPFACVATASQAEFSVEFNIVAEHGMGSRKRLELSVHDGAAALTGNLDVGYRSSLPPRPIDQAERVRIAEELGQTILRLEEPAGCTTTYLNQVTVTWSCDTGGPIREGQLSFTSNSCGNGGAPDVAMLRDVREGVAAHSTFGGAPSGYARAIAIASAARAILARYGLK